jgi:hypothetical protein
LFKGGGTVVEVVSRPVKLDRDTSWTNALRSSTPKLLPLFFFHSQCWAFQ